MQPSSTSVDASASKPTGTGLRCIEVGCKFVYFDAEDAPRVLPYSWSLTEPRPGVFYVRATVNGESVTMHRHLLSEQLGLGLVGDHKDGNGLNNSRTNLRVCTPSQNNCNRRANGGRRWKGVSLYKGSKSWVARITKVGVTYYLGSFATPRQAAATYNRVARRLHGEFAKLNELGRP